MKLIDNVILYTGKQSVRNGTVLVDGDKIIYAGGKAGCPDAAGAERVDGRGGILMPGFYNAHCHAAMTLLRGVGNDLQLMDWLHMIWPIEDKLDDEIIYWGTMQANMEMLMRGTVAYADQYFMEDNVARAALDSGIRANLSRGCMNVEGVESEVPLFKTWHGAGDGQLRVSMGVHAEYTTTPVVVKRAVELAKEYGMGYHVHVSETHSETQECIERRGVTPTRYFYDMGLLDSHTLAAHCVWMNDEDMELMAKTGACAVHNPASNLKLASGFAPVTKMLEKGIRVALGTDGAASNNALDMLSDMRLASILQKGFTGDPTALRAEDAITMATRSGAQAMGWEDCGLIEAGMQADMILLDGEAENLVTVPDVPSTIVYAAQGLNVKMTMVKGKVVYRDGQFLTFDAEEVCRKAKESAQKLGVI